MSTQIIAKFVQTHLVDVLVGASEGTQGQGGGPNSQKKAKNSDEIKNLTGTLSLGQKARFDTTPVAPNGEKYGKNDPVINGPEGHKPDGTSPIIEWELLKDDGTDLMLLGDANPFQLGSYEDNGGCTPTLKQNAQVGGGRNRLRFGPKVNQSPDWNGGTGVPASDYAEFYAD